MWNSFIHSLKEKLKLIIPMPAASIHREFNEIQKTIKLQNEIIQTLKKELSVIHQQTSDQKKFREQCLNSILSSLSTQILA